MVKTYLDSWVSDGAWAKSGLGGTNAVVCIGFDAQNCSTA